MDSYYLRQLKLTLNGDYNCLVLAADYCLVDGERKKLNFIKLEYI